MNRNLMRTAENFLSNQDIDLNLNTYIEKADKKFKKASLKYKNIKKMALSSKKLIENNLEEIKEEVDEVIQKVKKTIKAEVFINEPLKRKLSGMSKKNLYQLAKEKKLQGRGSMTKSELVKEILKS